MTKCPYCGSTRPFILEGRVILGLPPRHGCLDCNRWLDDGEEYEDELEDVQNQLRMTRLVARNIKAWARRWKRQAKLERRHRRVLRSGLYHRVLAAEAWARRWKRKAKQERLAKRTALLALSIAVNALSTEQEQCDEALARALAAEAKLSSKDP